MSADGPFRFPFERFPSEAAFRAFCSENRALLDARFAYEGELAGGAEPVCALAGTCPLCLCETRFVSRRARGERPNWREEQVCDCPDQLNCRFRLLLTFLASEIAPPPWTRALLLGAAQSIEARLQSAFAAIAVRARSGRLLRLPRFEPQSYHLILACDHLQAEPSLDAVLAGLREALIAGGTILVTVPFDSGSPVSSRPEKGKPGVLGWDLLARLAAAGFAEPAAHLAWSEEFGLLGPFNLLFSATA